MDLAINPLRTGFNRSLCCSASKCCAMATMAEIATESGGNSRQMDAGSLQPVAAPWDHRAMGAGGSGSLRWRVYVRDL
jgi:hypothetical protein